MLKRTVTRLPTLFRIALYIRLFEKTQAGEFDPAKGTLVAFAYGIAVMIQRESWRREKKWQFLELRDDHLDHVGREEQQVRILALRKAIRMLDPGEREVMQLLVDRDLQMNEIAGILNMPLNTVKSHVYRAKKNLRNLLSGESKHE